MPSVRASGLRWCQRCSLCLTVTQVCQPGCQMATLSAPVPLHWGGGQRALKCSRERSDFWFICCYASGQVRYHVAQRDWRISMLGDTQTSTGYSPEPYLTLLWAGTASGYLQRCLHHRLFYDPWEKLFCSKAGVYLVFFIMASISTRHNSAKYVTSSGRGKVLYLFFTVFLSFCNVKAGCISTDLCF